MSRTFSGGRSSVTEATPLRIRIMTGTEACSDAATVGNASTLATCKRARAVAAPWRLRPPSVRIAAPSFVPNRSRARSSMARSALPGIGRSARVVARLSIVPGLGHWYAGAPLKGLVFFAAIIGPLVVGTELDLTVVGAAVGIPLDIGGLGLWAFCAYDAYRTARNRM